MCARAWSGDGPLNVAATRSLLVGNNPVNTGDGERGTGVTVGGVAGIARSRTEGGLEPGGGTYGSVEPNLNRVPGG
jgi:hypothetical protein